MKDFVNYTSRVRKIYLIFGIIALAEVLLKYKKEDHILRALALFGAVLYILIFITISRLVADERPQKVFVYICLALVVLNSINYAAETIYTVIVAPNLYAIFAIFSVMLQVSTMYIFIKFLQAIDKENLLNAQGGNQFESPTYPVTASAPPAPATAVYSQGPMSDRTPPPVAVAYKV